MKPNRPTPAGVLQSLKELSITQVIADENAAAKAGTLRPLTAAQFAVLANAAPVKRGRVISSIFPAPRMTVQDLIRVLQTHNPDAVVVLPLETDDPLHVVALTPDCVRAVTMLALNECTLGRQIFELDPDQQAGQLGQSAGVAFQ